MSELSFALKNDQRIANRFIKSMRVACLAGSFVHLFLSIFYFIIEVPEMFIYAIISFFLFLFWRQLFKNKWIEVSFVMASLNTFIGMISADYYIGWESNFNMYFIILVAAFFLHTSWKVWKRSLYVITSFCLYLVLYYCFSDFEARYLINSEVLKYLSLVNTLSVVFILIMILLIFNSSIEEMQLNLENKNKDLKKKAKDLDYSLIKEKELGLLKTSFVSMASHQFKTPLAVIQSNAELFEMLASSGKIIEPEKYAKVTSRIVGAVASMTNLIDEVLVLGKVTSGNVAYTPENLDLVDFCEKLAEEFNTIQADGRSLGFVKEGDPIKLQLDPILLTHSLSNLISNAFKYSAGKENPQLSIHFKPTEVVLSVKDYGLGIPEEEQLKLFTPFFRANNAVDIKGSGLGLNIAKEYVEVNKGQISAKSILGEGSCFEITFKR